jgi:LysM repeat protein
MKRIILATFVVALLALLTVQPALAAPPSRGGFIHIVHWGETLSGIAVRYGTTVRALMHANGIANANRIYAGQRLYIPQGAPYQPPAWGNVYVVRPGETLSGIAWRFGVSVNSLVRANGIANPNRIYAGQRLVIPYGAPSYPHHGAYYRVRHGDTLSGIAWRFGVSVWAIVSANHLSNPNVIYAGQRLYIP